MKAKKEKTAFAKFHMDMDEDSEILLFTIVHFCIF